MTTYVIYLKLTFYTNVDVHSLRMTQLKGPKHVGVLVL